MLKEQQSLVEQVCKRLSRQPGRELADGEGWLPPERQLAEHLGVSRTVVREATKRLELQGLLEVQHGVGIRFVDKLYVPLNGSVELLLPETAERLRQLAEARLAIEPQVARMAAERAKAEHRRALHATQDRLAAAVETAAAIDADLEFHRVLARAAGNRILELVLESLGELGRTSRQATIAATGIARAHEHHSLILAAIEKRQGQEAHDTMRMHMEGSARDLAKCFAAKQGAAE
jgi:GntR family transcriptional regulator, transcriptional repressor for pyruvate dehydrogenase complex